MKYKFLTFIVLIVSVIFFYNVQDVNAGCVASGPVWIPNPAPWKNAATSQTFDFTQNYTVGNDPIGDAETITDSCTAAATNGVRCQVMGVHLTAYQDFDPCPANRDAWFNSPVNRIDLDAPVCGASWTDNTTNNTYTLTSASDALSGLSASNNYTCTATPGNFCLITIKDNTTTPNPAGNSRTCQSPTRPATTYTVTASANPPIGGNPAPVNSVISSGSPAVFNVNANTSGGYAVVSANGCPLGAAFNVDKTTYTTGPIGNNCNVVFNFTVIPTLSCAVDTAATPAPHYTGYGVKFLASGGVGTYSWNAAGSTGDNGGTDSQIWPAWSTSGTKTVNVSSGAQNASCSVNITALPLPMSGSISASNCTIPLNGSSCSTSLNWGITNPVATPTAITASGMTNINVSNSTSPASQSGTTTASVPYSSRTFYLYNNNVLLAQATATASCVSGSAWNGTICQSTAIPINGICSATHYACNAGSSTNNVSGATTWTWTCLGSGGGTNASCSETKTFSPELIASAPTPAAVIVGTPVIFASTISNVGDASTGTSFYNLFQRASSANGGGTITDITSSLSTATLANGATRSVSSPSYTFTTVGTYSVRACADKSSTASTGTIVESNESNNCSSWTNVTVSNSIASGADLTAGPTTPTVTATWSYTVFSSTISNIGTVSTGASFSNFFQIRRTVNGVETFTNLYAVGMSPLAAGASAIATSPTVNFSAVGIRSVRACSDKTDPSSTGTITETDENNNCGPWVDVTITNPGVPVVTISANPTSGNINVVNPTLTWSATNTPTSCTASGNGWSGSKPVSGTNVAQVILTVPGTYTYTLTCSNANGASAPASVAVEAIDPLANAINGQCSDPDNHVIPCSSGDASAIDNGISSWKWSCLGIDGGTSVSCEELKKKPIFIED